MDRRDFLKVHPSIEGQQVPFADPVGHTHSHGMKNSDPFWQGFKDSALMRGWRSVG